MFHSDLSGCLSNLDAVYDKHKKLNEVSNPKTIENRGEHIKQIPVMSFGWNSVGGANGHDIFMQNC